MSNFYASIFIPDSGEFLALNALARRKDSSEYFSQMSILFIGPKLILLFL